MVQLETVTPLPTMLARKRTVGGEEKCQYRVASDLTIKDENNAELNDFEESVHSDDPSTASCYLINLPTHLRTHLWTFMSINDISTASMTCKQLYKERHNHRIGNIKNSIFHLVLEEHLPNSEGFRTELQNFRFLFGSPRYGMIQVDVSLAIPPRDFTPRHLHFRSASPVPESSWERVYMRINIQKKFPNDQANKFMSKVIFRLDQTLPGCSFHFESNHVVGWGPGHLGSLVQKCVLRMKELQSSDDYKPPPEHILSKFQATMKENILRGMKKLDKDRNSKYEPA